MPNPTYERVSDNDADEDFVDIPSQTSRVRPGPEPVVRPPVYYGDGPFDPPSSEEDEDRFLDKSERRGVLDPDEFGDSEPGNGLRVGGGKVSTTRSVIPWSSYALHAQRPAALRYLIYSLASLVFLSACIGVFAATNLYHGKPYHASRERKVSLDHIFNGTFNKYIQDLHWVPEGTQKMSRHHSLLT